ncbi:DUF433 domain-containing protein [Luteolibacter arcticus]|uniref:DUF433 domain-containing protein n=1 Tax=Luteolibacter arcticus TaxID=1581411 RepID=A0ABT3GMX6_9BACT|nr:DUF433 domain-containing protein [Luteolibacter arcticus]MCW1924871.1 DUF433 domain-containing protein [Luteolibacter arcticus]
MTVASSSHIRLDHEGRAWIDDTNVKVIEVVLSYFAADGSIPSLVENHPHLTPARIHAAMAWYHDHREQLDRQIAADSQWAGQLAAERQETALMGKLRAARDARR